MISMERMGRLACFVVVTLALLATAGCGTAGSPLTDAPDDASPGGADARTDTPPSPSDAAVDDGGLDRPDASSSGDAADAGDASTEPDAGIDSGIDGGGGDGGSDSGCDVVCSTNHITAVCEGSTCGGTCEPGYADCNGDKKTDGCEASIESDPDRCGGCELVCSGNHIAARTCSSGECDGACDPGFADCNDDKRTDGCEIATSNDPANCGACAQTCQAPQNAIALCVGGQCSAACVGSYVDCNMTMNDGCETDIATSVTSCGACGQSCSTNHVAVVDCTQGDCSSSCAPGFADCNEDKRTDGCETATSADMRNCGACGVVCRGTVGRGCVDGACLPTCDDGLENQGEGDIDCGGPCLRCDVGRMCTSDHDCRSGSCKAGVCAAIVCEHRFGLPGPPTAETGSTPQAAAVADFDLDGKPDVLVANFLGDSVSVLRGLGGGRFAPRLDSPVSSPMAAAAGDLDGDGNPDAVAVNFYGASVSVLLGNGTGALAAPVAYPTSGLPIGVAIGDLNGDALPDVVVASRGAYGVEVLLNQGAGVLGAAVRFSTFLEPTAVALGDMNGDQILDLVATDAQGGGVSILLNDGSGAFGPPTSYHGLQMATGLALADLDGDEALDVVASNLGYGGAAADGAVSVFLNQGAGTLGAKVDYAVGAWPRGVIAADLNGDGLADVATANYGSSDVSVLLNQGGGAFGLRVDYAVGFGPYPLAVGDFDLNGDLDLVSANQQVDTMSVLLNHGEGFFRSRTDHGVGVSPRQIAFGDVNGDGALDLVTVNSTDFLNSANTATVFLNVGAKTFIPGVTVTTGAKPMSLALGDFDGNGSLDLATANFGDDTISVFLNPGNGAFAAHMDYPVSSVPSSLVASDLDGDGRVDLAFIHHFGIGILYNRGNGQFDPPVNHLTTRGHLALAQGLAAGDLNRDGRPDLAFVRIKSILGGQTPALEIFLNGGARTFTQSIYEYWMQDRPLSLVMGDVNGDKYPDLVVGSENARVRVFTNDGFGQFALASYSTRWDVQSVAIGDVNGDMIPDLVVATAHPGLGVFISDSPGVFGPRVDYATTQAAALAGADLDGDGRMDLATAGGAFVSVLPNACLP